VNDFIPIRNGNEIISLVKTSTKRQLANTQQLWTEGSSPVYCNYSVSMVAVLSAPALLVAIASLAARCSSFVPHQHRLLPCRFRSLDVSLDAASTVGGGLLGFIGGGSTKIPRNGNEKYVVGLVRRQSASFVVRLNNEHISATVCTLNSARCEAETNKLSRQ
jgi:hypothetical protein